MPIVLDGEIRNPLRPLTEYTAPLGDVLGATASDTLYNSPMSAIFRSSELTDAQLGEYNGEQRAVLNPLGGVARYDPVRGPTTDVIDADTARSQVQALGLKLKIPDDGIPERALAIIIERKQDEIKRQVTMQRAAPGLGTQMLRLGTALGASLLDPLNVGLAFVPVVGEMRYAAMLARAGSGLGRAGVRAGVGAVEGGVGAALIEPVIYSANQQEQADYSMADSLLNIGLGTVFGGGLHVVGGAVKDRFRPNVPNSPVNAAGAPEPHAIPELRETADAPRATLETAPKPAQGMTASQIVGRIVQAEQTPGFLRSAEDLIALRVERSPEIDRAVEIAAKPGFQRSAEENIFLKAMEKGAEPEYINARVAEVARGMGEIDEKMAAAGQTTEAVQVLREQKAQLELALVKAQARLADLGINPQAASRAIERASPQTREAALRTAVGQAAAGRVVDVDPFVKLDPAASWPNVQTAQKADVGVQNMKAAGERNQSPAGVAIADAPAARAADQRLAAAPKDAGVQAAEKELADALEQIKRVSAGADEKQGETLAKELKPFDEALADADKLGDAARVGVVCGL